MMVVAFDENPYVLLREIQGPPTDRYCMCLQLAEPDPICPPRVHFVTESLPPTPPSCLPLAPGIAWMAVATVLMLDV